MNANNHKWEVDLDLYIFQIHANLLPLLPMSEDRDLVIRGWAVTP